MTIKPTAEFQRAKLENRKQFKIKILDYEIINIILVSTLELSSKRNI